MNAKPTPGPWEAWPDADTNQLAVGPKMGGVGVCDVVNVNGIGISTEDTRATGEANARLVAAAVNACFVVNPENPLAVAEALPEIVTALKRIEMGMSFPEDDVQRTARDVARAALAKIGATP